MKPPKQGLELASRKSWTPTRWRRGGDLFDAAKALPVAERKAFLLTAASDDSRLRDRVEKMLQADQESGGLLDHPLIADAQEPIDDREEGEGGAVETMNDSRIGTLIGPYRLLENLGKGGMGTVYLARREDGVDRKVALKLVRPGFDPDLVQRLRSESALQARVEHLNVARLYDAGSTRDGTPYLVMEHVEGLPLIEACRRHGSSLEEKIDLFCQICAGVQAAHRSLLVHRDLKPANILVTADGVPKLLDFGVAKLLGPDKSEQGHTSQARRWLTPRYASPEQIQGRSLDTRSDIYSLGVVLFELLTGQSPYGETGSSAVDWERAIDDRTPRRPSDVVSRGSAGHATVDRPKWSLRRSTDLRAKLRGDLDTIILKALSQEPDRRYSSAEALAEDLRRWRSNRPILARSESGLYRLRKFLRRHRAALVLLAVATFSLAIVGALLLSQLTRHAREMDRERTEAEQVSELLIEILTTVEGTPPETTSVSASELLEAGLRKVSAAKRQDPLVRASVLRTIGRVFHRLSRSQEAEETLLQSLVLLRDAEDTAPGDTADVLHDLASVQRKLGKLDEAQTHLGQALELRRELRHRRPDLLADVLYDLALLSWDRRDLSQSELYFRQALEWQKIAAPDDPDSWVEALQAVAELSGDADLMAETAALRRQQTSRLQELVGPRHPDVAKALLDLGALESSRGLWHEASELYRKAYESLLVSVGSAHHLTVGALLQLAASSGMIGEYEKSEAYYRLALANVNPELPEDHPETLAAVHNLARMLSYQKKFAEAEETLRRVLAGTESRYPDDPCQTAHVYFSLASNFHIAGRFEEADKYYRHSETVCEDQGYGRSYLPTDVAVAYLRFDQGRGEEVCPQPLEQVQTGTYPGSADPAIQAEIQALRGACVAVGGDLEDGEKLLFAARQVLIEHRGHRYPLVGWIERRLSRLGV